MTAISLQKLCQQTSLLHVLAIVVDDIGILRFHCITGKPLY